MMEDVWNRIWDERGRDYPEDDPAKISGYDQAFSMITPEVADRHADTVARQLDLRPDDALLDMGCGAGMLLSRLSPRVRRASGTDRSEGMVARLRKLYPRLDVQVAEARSLPFPDATFDKVLAHGVFQYFPDEGHALAALDELARLTRGGGRIVLCDLMDLDTRAEYLAFRARLAAAAPAGSTWTSSVCEPVSHLYLRRGFFERWGRARGFSVRVSDRDVPGYANARFRFDVIVDRT